MLREIRPARHVSSRISCRRFTNADMELLIWVNQQMPIKFHFSYGKRGIESAIHWDSERGFTHGPVVDDELALPASDEKQLLLHTPACDDLCRTARRFLAASEMIDPSLADFIYARLLEHPHFRLVRPDLGALSVNL